MYPWNLPAASAIGTQMLTSGLQLDLDSRRGLTAGTGSGQAGWADVNPASASYNGFSATQSTASDQPTLTAHDASYGYQPSINCASASTQSLIRSTTLTLATPYTIYVVAKAASLPSINIAFTVIGSKQTNVPWNTPTQFGVHPGSSAGTVNAGTSDTNVHAYALVEPGTGTGSFYVDTSSAALANFTGYAADSLGGAVYICSDSGAPYWNGSLVKILIYNVAHTATQVSTNFKYFAGQYLLSTAANENAEDGTRLALLELPRANHNRWLSLGGF